MGSVPANFHGKKGRSGRKCVRDEQLRVRVIEKAWTKKEQKMNDSEATQIVLKDMTGKETININLPKPILDVCQKESIKEQKKPEEILEEQNLDKDLM